MMYTDFMVLGGAGLVGFQVCRKIATQLEPKRIIVASLWEHEATFACRDLEQEFGDAIAFVPVWGDLFVPTEMASVRRAELLNDADTRKQLLEWLYGDFDTAYPQNHLVKLIRTHRPEVIVDSVNTATGLSYQNVFDGAAKLLSRLEEGDLDGAGRSELEQFLLSQSVPQLVRHVRFLHRATTEYKTKVYVKVGTTGTGGMGLNIPYTHSEDKPSKVLLAKTEAAFGHTGLLFLLARTPDAPIVKEVKPAAMIGYKAVKTVVVADRHGNRQLFLPKSVDVKGKMVMSEASEEYSPHGDLLVTIVDTGENGVFTRGEFAAITALGQMEYVTPEEIAHVVTLEIRGANSGQDIISALDASVINPSYKAGLVREVAMHDLRHEESQSNVPSIALGRLGPPELSKLLFEANLLKEAFGTLQKILELSPEEINIGVGKQLKTSQVRHIAPSIGIPILLPDGAQLLRGPRINVPEVSGHQTTVSLNDKKKVEQWAAKGWIDLRVSNMATWKSRFERMLVSRQHLRVTGSAAANIQSYLPADFEIGEVVAWIFNNEFGGHRIK